MRLKKLTIQAFGPFKEKHVINFEDDDINKGLLLITGDTGAGKTTIFDAICFALYGQASGDTRTGASLRSDFASSESETFVELEFYNKGKLYIVKRNPEYTRKARRGEGETKQVANAELEYDGKVITKVNDVTKKIEEIIGLDYKQFKEVALLSQGEFTKFLLASSDDKTTIFRKIFNTSIYDNLQNKLKSNRLSLETEFDRIKDKIETEKSKLEKYQDINSLTNDELLVILETKISSLSDETKLIKELRDKTNDEQSKLKQEIDEINKTNKKILDLENASNSYKSLLNDNKNINDDIKVYDYNINVVSILKKEYELIETITNTLNSNRDKLNKQKELLDLTSKTFKEKEEVFKEYENYSSKVSSLNDKLVINNNLITKYNSYLKLNKESNETKESLIKVIEEYTKENKVYEDMRRSYYLNVSVELAEGLVEGAACPVCGSKEHPHLAKSKETNITKEELETQEERVKSIEGKRKSLEALTERLTSDISALEIKNINVDEELNKITKEQTSIKESIKDLEETNKKLSKEKEELTNKITSLKDSIKLLEEAIKESQESIKEHEEKIEKIYDKNDTDEKEYNKLKLDNSKLNLLKIKIEKYNSDKNRLEGIISTLEKEVKGKKITSTEEKTKEYELKLLEYKTKDDEYKNKSVELNSISESSKNIKKYMDDYNETSKKYEIVKILSDTANGQLTGKKRLSFENYVQAHFLKYMLVEANKRLSKMTDGRFELKRKEEVSSLAKKTGLDFSVFDSYTGKERDVASLSGGEKFKASLSLALGLSDVISMNAGGIKVDSLFIDEGFGSLDPESLNQAISILEDLSSNDKLVGVISHVSELMNRIDNKIIVKKTTTGSNIIIEAN